MRASEHPCFSPGLRDQAQGTQRLDSQRRAQIGERAPWETPRVLFGDLESRTRRAGTQMLCGLSQQRILFSEIVGGRAGRGITTGKRHGAATGRGWSRGWSCGR